jgi:hypothetical protein
MEEALPNDNHYGNQLIQNLREGGSIYGMYNNISRKKGIV